MIRPRVIPCLLLHGNGLVKTKKFKNPVYIGDPVNAVRIFSEKEVDEIVILDIDASKDDREPNYRLIEEIAGEAFMPMAYGGGINSVDQIQRLIRSGIEKVVINSAVAESTNLIREAANIFGSQAIVAGVDVRKNILGKFQIYVKSGTRLVKSSLEERINSLMCAGAGEIFLNNIDRDGMMSGYDIELLKKVTEAVTVPVVACGGAGKIEDLTQAIHEGGVSGVAAGSMFVFQGKHRAVLINYPKINNV